MSYTKVEFKPAVLQNVQLLISLAGGTGSGKTWSALELATGLARGKRFAGVDTERGRMLHYAKYFAFDHAEINPPFRPQAYLDAILSADEAGYPVIVADSYSHEWAGEGGMLDWHDQIVEEEIERKREMAEKRGYPFDEWQARAAANLAAWIEPKKAHKAMVQRLLQLKAHLILAFRAEEKIEIVKLDKDGKEVERGGKTVIRPKESMSGLDGWIPVTEKNLPYEMTMSFLLTRERPGVPLPIKLQQQHRALIDLNKPLSRATGEALAKWSEGDATLPAAPQETTASPPNLYAIVAAIKVAETEEQLKQIAARAKELSEVDQGAARVAYKERLGILKTPTA